MSMSVIDLHKDLLKACLGGDLNRVMLLSYFHKDLIRSLILDGIPPPPNNQEFPGEFQPGEYLHAASMLGHHEIVAELIKEGADPYMKCRYGTPLKIACRNGHLNVVRLLHTSGVDFHRKGEEIWDSGIYAACQEGHLDILQYILSSSPELLTKKTEGFQDGCILFYAACKKGHVAVAKLLVEKGIDINALVFNRDGSLAIPLDAACMSENYELINYLLSQNIELPRTTIDQYPYMFKPAFQSMMKRYKRPHSLRTERPSDASKNALIVSWNSKNLRGIHESWLVSHASMISSIDLHQNKITELPACFFELLPNLEDIDLSVNLLTTLPDRRLDECRLSRLIASKNKLHSLPLTLFHNPYICTLDFYKNKLRYLPPEENSEDFDGNGVNIASTILWSCKNLRTLKLANNELARIPKAIHGASKLENLNVSNNELISFVKPWNCPMEILDLSGNQLSSFDENIHLFWTKSLRWVSVAGNKLSSIPWSICQLENLSSLDISRNRIESVPPPNYWSVKSLTKLNLSHNLLSASCGPEGFAHVEKKRVEAAISSGNEPSFVSNCDLPVNQLQNTLQVLDLSDNKLEMVPETVCMLTALRELILSNNPQIKALPPELGKLGNLWNLKVDNLSLKGISTDIRGPGFTKRILGYLRSTLRNSVPFNRMKLMVVGLQGRGKTTLLSILQHHQPPTDNIATVGISVDQWNLQPVSNQGPLKFFGFFGSSVSSPQQEIVFSTWDLAGQHVYYATHQCFLTSNTLYLVVWNIEHGQEGIERLAPWLLNIQARAPKSEVVIVATHLDKIPQIRKKERLAQLEKEIFKKYSKKGFPRMGGSVFVSNRTEEGIPKLKEVIYRVASKMQDSNLHEPIIGKKVPLSYLQLYDAVRKEAERRAATNEPPILTSDELLQVAKNNQDNDIYDVDELNQAAKFLHDHGVLLHYNDYLRGLNNLYFIDPSWLCDVIALIVTVREKNPFVRDGFIKSADIMHVLKNPRLPVHFIPQYLQILERFEIALGLDDERILVPSMLPRERPTLNIPPTQGMSQIGRSTKRRLFKKDSNLDDNESLNSIPNYILRNYHLSYIPAGFWSRLIARFIIAIQKWGMIVSDQFEDEDEEGELSGDGASKDEKNSSNHSMVYWREGILVMYEAGSFLIQSFKDNFENNLYGNEGVSIIVQSGFKDFSVMGFIVDQIDRLIAEWYPGLEDIDEFGEMMVQRMIPCATCALNLSNNDLPKYATDPEQLTQISNLMRNPEHVKQFPLTVCAMAALRCDKLQCDNHLDEPVLLVHMVPDLLLSDLPTSMVLDKAKFEFEANDETKLGTGGAGEVYKAVYDGNPIAVKKFHSSSNARRRSSDWRPFEDEEFSGTISDGSLYIPREQSIGDCLEDGKVIRSFWELRQEVAVLVRLQHPCIVKLIGVCRIPLCFGLELAPKGGLYSILEKVEQEREHLLQENPSNPPIFRSILGKPLTFKIALQVAHALLYLHESEIVYRDLKSDNVLVWSLNENDVINVKLSDYGISCFATPQGVLGEEGTPGFQAPEVSFGCAYDEKVDIFSFGIWLYELVSGRRPLREHKTQADIRRAVQNGVRPSLHNVHVMSKMPFLELLMQDCWVDQSQSRPSAFEVVQRLENPTFYCLRNSYPTAHQKPIEHITCLIPLAQLTNNDIFYDGHASFSLVGDDNKRLLPGDCHDKLLIWCNTGKDRRFIIVDAETGTVHNDIPCMGPRVLCAAIVGKRIWLGTTGCQIEVFGRHCWQIPRVLWSFSARDATLSLLVEPDESKEPMRVFASHANGTVTVFQRTPYNGANYPNATSASGADEDAAIEIEKNEWQETTIINLANGNYAAKSMVFTKKGQELWAASGNSIAIIDVQNLQLIGQIRVFSLVRQFVTQLISDGERVWTVDKKSSIVYQWDVQTRKKLFKFDCDLTCNAKGMVLAQAVSDSLFEEITDSPPLSKRNKSPPDIIPEEKTPETTLENAASPPSRSQNSSVNLLQISPLLAKATRKLHMQPSILFSPKKRKLGKKIRNRQNDTESVSQLRPRAGAYSNTSVHIGPILLVGDTLWIGRGVGDILVINIREPLSNTVATSVRYNDKNRNDPVIFGEVLCHLEDEQGKQANYLKEVTQLRKCGRNHVVSAMRVESKEEKNREIMRSRGGLQREWSEEKVTDNFKLLIYEAWQTSDFEKFCQNLNALHALEH